MKSRRASAISRAMSWLPLLLASILAESALGQFGFDAAPNSIWRRLPQKPMDDPIRRLPPTEYPVQPAGNWQPEVNRLPPPAQGPQFEFQSTLPGPSSSDMPAVTELMSSPWEMVSPGPPVSTAGGRRSPRNYTPNVGEIPMGVEIHASPFDTFDWYHFGVLGRTYYQNDQRIEFSGVEATVGAEGILAGGVRRDAGQFEMGGEMELFFNQRFDRNVLADSAERRSYLANWEVDTLEISQFYLFGRRGDWMMALGKMPTPFGRTYFPLYLNDRSDAPFIRSESILWRETALLFQFDPDNWVMTVGMMNGGEDRDANSSKGLIARVAYESPWFALGGSIKTHDGIGSEGQKTFNDHVGIDMMVRRGRFTFSTEAIYDQYGLRRQLNPLNITWGRSIYFREQNIGMHVPIIGFGYYVNFGYEGDHWTTMLNYGEFHPQQIGVRLHDVVNRRGIVKLIRHHLNADFYVMMMIENDVEQAQNNILRRGTNILTGFQLSL